MHEGNIYWNGIWNEHSLSELQDQEQDPEEVQQQPHRQPWLLWLRKYRLDHYHCIQKDGTTCSFFKRAHPLKQNHTEPDTYLKPVTASKYFSSAVQTFPMALNKLLTRFSSFSVAFSPKHITK